MAGRADRFDVKVMLGCVAEVVVVLVASFAICVLVAAVSARDLDAASNSDLNHMYDEWRELLSALGRVQHLILKREQRIRIGAESDEVFGEALAAALARMIAAITDAHGIDARDAFLATAERVLARNWTANPTTGAAAPQAAP